MKKQLLSILIFLASVGQAWGATYNIGPGQTYTTFAAFHAAVLVKTGDIVDGGNNIFYERVVPNGPATYRNFTLDGRVSLNGSWSYNPGNTYSNISSWSLVAGTKEIYKKTSTRLTYMVYEDGMSLIPILAANEAAVLSGLARGQYTWVDPVLYYRGSDGANPATHDITGTGRGSYDAPNEGILYASGIDGLTISNVTIRYHAANTVGSYSVIFSSCTNLTLSGLVVTENRGGVQFTGCSNVTMNSTCSLTRNRAGGMLVEGNSNAITITGNISYNGRDKFYNGPYYTYTGDTDGIGIGGVGGTLTNITIQDATISYNGPPDGDQIAGDEKGAGIYSGTSYDMTVTLNILRNNIFKNHTSGIFIDHEFLRGTIAYNIVRDNLNYAASDYPNAIHIMATNANFTKATIANNIIYQNYGNAGLYINATGPGKIVSVQNNIFYNNGRIGNFYGDLWISGTDLSKVSESNNIFYRKGTAWDSAKVIQIDGASWDLNHIAGNSAGYWQYDRGKGSGDIVADPLFVSSSNFYPQVKSPAINAGVYVPGVHDIVGATDIAGQALSNVLVQDIGTYKFKFTGVPPSPPQSLRVITK